MEKKFTLVLSLLLLNLFSFAAAPTVSASNLEFTVIEGDKLTLRFTKGNGQFRIVVMKEGAPIGALPVNGVDYAFNQAYGTPGTAFADNDGFVVYKGSGTNNLITIPVSNLNPATTYYVSVFEFNGSGAATEYYMVALTGSKATASAPTTQGSFKPATNIVGNSATLNWNLGNGARRLILARKGAPVNVLPEDLKAYTGDSDFGDATPIGGDNYPIYSGASTTTLNVNNLEPNTTYHFAMFEYNGSSGPVYLKDPVATYSLTTSAGPTRSTGALSYPIVDGTKLQISFSKGNGKHQLIIARKGAPVTAVPENGRLYEASTIFGNGEEIADGEFVLNSLDNSRTFTNLEPRTVYYFRVFDFDIDANGYTYYLTSQFAQGSQSTAVPPVNSPKDINITSVTGTSFSITYNPGDSKYRLVVVKAGSEVDAVPQDLIKYSGSSNFGQGNEIAPGNYVIYGSTNSSAGSVSMLTPGVTYHIAIWGWNGLDFPVYKQEPARASVTIPNEPASPATNYIANQIEGNSFVNSWSGGDGSRRLVIARMGQPVTARPQDGQTYTASSNFGEGTEVEDGQFVVHDGIGRSFSLKNLQAGTTYHVAIFEYNVTNGLPDYRTSTFLAGQATTLSAPTEQATGVFADLVTATTARINLSKGNGSQRLVVLRANSPVSVEPQNFVMYQWNQSFGTPVAHMGDGNYVVGSPASSGPVNVLALQPNTTYHIAVFEYNGGSGPVYLRPGAVGQFTTESDGGITAPTLNASNPSFTADGNKLTFKWNKGNGSRRIVVMKQGADFSFVPANGSDYPANAAFGSGTDLGGGHYVAYNGTAEEAEITNLQAATSYSLAVYEYNGTGANIKYLVTDALAVQQSTAVAPATGSSSPETQVTSGSITLTWQKGNGERRLVVMKEGSAISGKPTDLSKYTAAAQFKQGSQIAAGEYVVYAGTGSSVTVTALEPQKTYHFSIFEYNGQDGPVYNTVNVLSGQVVTTGALPLTWVYFTVKEKQSKAELSWGTTDELHTAYFVIERSVGGSFIAIDSVPAKNVSGDHDYSYSDAAAPAGTVRYRIKQVDLDGKYSYSKVVVISIASRQAAISLYPNPAKESLKVVLPSGVLRAALTVYDANGKVVMNTAVNNGEVISISKLPQGMYTVLVQEGEKRWVERLMKL